MDFRGDDRGVTVQVGAILLFGLLILSMSAYQTTVVPAENEQVEFRHNQQVQEDLQSVRSAVSRTVGTGVTQSVAVRAGTQYPERALFVNPPSPSGTLRTEALGESRLRNARALDDETADYWGPGETKSFSTTTVRYEPSYHVYRNAPATVYENGVLYNEFSATNRVPQSGQTLVDGRRISLVVVDGDLSQSQTGTLGVDVRPTSVSERTVTVEAEGGPLTVAVASTLSEETWREQLLDGEYDENGPDAANGEPDDGRYVVDVTKTDGVVELTLEAGYDYDLNLTKVGVGTDVTDPTPTYLTGVDGDGETVSESGERRVVAEVRDEFDNPVSGVTVNASVDGPGTVTSTAVSGSDGRAAFTYTPENVDGERSATVTTTFGASPGAKERVEFDLSVVDSDGSGGGSGDGSGGSAEINPADPGAVVQRGATIGNDGRVAVTLENTDGDRRRVVEAVRFNFYSQDSQGGAGTDPPTTAVFEDGEATLPVRGAYRDVSVPIEAGGNRTLSFAFDDRQGQRHRVDEGDFFVFSVLYDDGDAATYFVAPERDGNGGGGQGNGVGNGRR